MPDTNLETRGLQPGLEQAASSTSGSVLLFGDDTTAPLWMWLVLETDELEALEEALLEHLRSPLFPARVGERAVHPGDDAGLLDFASAFAPISGRFAQGRDLVVAATRIVCERGGPLCRQAALACVEALQHRQHAEARNLSEPGTPSRLRHFVLASRLCADLWLRFVPSVDSGRSLPSRLSDVTETRPAPAPQPAAVAPAPMPSPLDTPGIRVLQPFEPPNDRTEWQSYLPLASPMPLRRVPRDARQRMEALAAKAPAFAAPLSEIRRTLALAAHAGRPSPRLRPILLVGAPGIGKTWFARRLAQALDLPFAGLNLGGATDNRCLQGTARGWSAATPAWPIAEMARLSAPNPLLFLDEVDKAGGQRENNGRAHDTLLAMIEPESAASWFDECLRTTADLRNVLWIMAANETRGIPAPLLSRVSVHQIEPPPASAFPTVLAGLMGGIAGDIGCEIADLPALEGETQDALRRSFASHRNLRRLRAAVEECLGVAAEAVLSAAN